MSNRHVGQCRPIIFVAHSLGGIIVKEALRQAHTSLEAHFNRIYKTTYAVLFLGCPHRGSGQAKFGKMAARMSQLALLAPNRRVIDSLQPNNVLLEIIANAFATYLGSIRVYSFREEKGMSGFAGLNGKVSMHKPFCG